MTFIGKNLALLSLIITFCLLSSDIKSRNHSPIDIFEIKRYPFLSTIDTITNWNNYGVQIS